MAATFDPTLPTDRDWLRFQIGDTDTALPLLEDEVYDAQLAASGDRLVAGSVLLTGLISFYSLQPDSINVPGEISISWKERIPTWRALSTAWSTITATEAAGASGFGNVAATRDGVTKGEYTGILFT